MSREMIMTADMLAHEKNLPLATVMEVLEKAYEKTLHKEYISEQDETTQKVKVSIDRHSGVATGKLIKDSGEEVLLDMQLNRAMTSSLKQRLVELLRAAQKESMVLRLLDNEYLLFRAKIINIRKGDLICEIAIKNDNLEVIVPKEDKIFGRDYEQGETIEVIWKNQEDWRKYFMDKHEKFDRKVIASHNSKEWMEEWITREIGEIEEGKIKIKHIARRAGVRTKIGVSGEFGGKDPIYIINGPKGQRIKQIRAELQPEQIDFFVWQDDPIDNLMAALGQTSIQKISLDEERKIIDLVTEKEEIAKIYGKQKVNIKLISEIIGWKIRVHSSEDWAEQSEQEAQWIMKMFTESLNMDEETAKMLYEVGFSSVYDIAYVTLDDALETGLDDEKWWKDLQEIAVLTLETEDYKNKWEQWDNSELDNSEKILLKNNNFNKLEEVADLDSEEIMELIPELDENKANNMIMKAREIVYFK